MGQSKKNDRNYKIKGNIRTFAASFQGLPELTKLV